ncbi:MAG TPA: RecX family transcriptional regulator [Candidatus Saccharimonadales bacterium]|nr:RecX family transcriptional regulator [Candidatus Saccharimonadales bacterium]
MRITNIKQQIRRADRYSIFIDGKYSFSLGEAALLSEGLASGQELDESRLCRLKEASGADKAYGNALRYVAMRPRSVWEVRTYLQRKDVDEPVAEGIIKRLEAVGLLDDNEFARSWTASRRLLKSISKRKLRMELQQKRVPEAIIGSVLQEDKTDERQTLRGLIAKKRGRYPDQAKLMQYLARQGFGYDDIKSAMQESAEDY